MWTPGDRPVDWCCHGRPSSLWCGSRRLTCCSTSPSPPPAAACRTPLLFWSSREPHGIFTKTLGLHSCSHQTAVAAVTAPAASIRSPIKWQSLQSFQYFMWINVQAFLDFHGFDFCDFWFTAVYNSTLFSSPLVLLSNLNLRSFYFHWFFYVPPH